MRTTVKLNGKKTVIDTNRPKVAKALVALVEACATPEFKIGINLRNANQDSYELVSIREYAGGPARAYLVNNRTGIARNSTKVVPVLGNKDDGFYTEDLPCQKDKFFDPDGSGEFIDC